MLFKAKLNELNLCQQLMELYNNVEVSKPPSARVPKIRGRCKRNQSFRFELLQIDNPAIKIKDPRELLKT